MSAGPNARAAIGRRGPDRVAVDADAGPPRSTTVARRWEGRLFGALVLAAFLLYGIGSAMADRPVGLVLVATNSVAVTVLGLLGYRLLRPSPDRLVGFAYLVARVAEAALLAGGIAVAAEGDTAGYLLGMVALGLGSIPFCSTIGRQGWLPPWLARWGVVGYAILAAGALLELTTGRAVTVALAVPGGLFELVLGLVLLRRGFDRAGDTGVG